MHTLEVMKAGGLVDTFIMIIKSRYVAFMTSQAEMAMESLGGEGTQIDDLSDKLFPEALFLFLYVMALSFIGAALEPALVALSRKVDGEQDT